MSTKIYKISVSDKSSKLQQHQETFISSGCPIIDKSLRGGFSKKGITQIYGKAGSGKTQIALQLCLTVQQKKDHEEVSLGAVYICTDAPFPNKRLQQMLLKSKLSKEYSISTDMIFIEHIESAEELETYLTTKLVLLLNSCKIGVIIIDSIAAPFVAGFETDEIKNRAISLRKISLQLHHLSRTYGLGIICINQVRSDLSTGESEVPALGITWENAITNSIYLYRSHSKRFAKVITSPYLPRKVIEFEVYDAGVKGVEE